MMLFITFCDSRCRTTAFQTLPVMLGWFMEYAGLQDNIVSGEIKTVKSLLNMLQAFGHFCQ